MSNYWPDNDDPREDTIARLQRELDKANESLAAAGRGEWERDMASLRCELEAMRKERDAAELATAEKIANALDEVAGNLLRDRTSDAIDGYNAAVMIDFAATIRRDFRAALSQPVQPVEDAPIKKRPMPSSYTAFDGPSSEPVEDDLASNLERAFQRDYGD